MSTVMNVHVKPWRPSRLRNLTAVVAYPVFALLNRPALSWFGNAVYDFALRCNGVAITFPGRHGLTRAEERFLRRQSDRFQNGILLDVGANGGSYARFLAALAPSARIFAFEPHPATFAALRSNLGSVPNVTVINEAVGEASGRTMLYDFATQDGSTQASLSQEAGALFTPEVVGHSVQCTTIDTFLARSNLDRIDLLKIDTEGLDLAVLKGAGQAIAEGRIRMIQFEFIPANVATRVRMHDFFDALPGYDLFRLCLNGDLLPLGTYDVKRHEIYVTHNLVAISRSAR